MNGRIASYLPVLIAITAFPAPAAQKGAAGKPRLPPETGACCAAVAGT
jgi:hypothetical protein